jgi:hypothetical protein
LPEVVGDDDVADPTDQDADHEAGGRRVHGGRDVELLPPEVAEAEDEPADEPAEHREPALPHLQRIDDRPVAREMTDHVEPAGTDDRADRAPRHGVVHLRARDAARLGALGHQPRAEEEPERGADAVR